MTNAKALSTAILIHYFLRVTIFIDPPKEQCSVSTEISSFLFLITICMILSDYEVLSDKFQTIPFVCRYIIETAMTLFYIEFGMISIWCKFEGAIERTIKRFLMDDQYNLYYDMGGNYLTGGMITTISFLIFINIAMVTDYSTNFTRMIREQVDKLMTKINSVKEETAETFVMPAAEEYHKEEEYHLLQPPPPPLVTSTHIKTSPVLLQKPSNTSTSTPRQRKRQGRSLPICEFCD